jgi:UDP-N-acetylglucosamine transferase subunit ALG13
MPEISSKRAVLLIDFMLVNKFRTILHTKYYLSYLNKKKINTNHFLIVEKMGKIPFSSAQFRILVAPLDWGLGHATRCIPVINELLKQNANVCIAAEGSQEHLLRAEFPEIDFISLPGYRIHYAKTSAGLIWQMIKQIPKITGAIRSENRWLKKIQQEYGFDAVISDNRYGLYHPEIPCVFITHQLKIKSGIGKWAEKILQKKNYKYISRFSQCWAPDADHENNLAGDLSNPQKKPAVPLKYIGWLSRFQKKETGIKKNHICIILSGPEPQRGLLEEKIINEISHYNGTATIIRGLPGALSLIPSTNMIRFYNHLSSDKIHEEIAAAEYIISRSGYSTIMDIAALQKRSILIPTPGQTEQEYLAARLAQKNMAVCLKQKDFSLQKSLAAAANHNYVPFPENDNTLLQKAVGELLFSLSKK